MWHDLGPTPFVYTQYTSIHTFQYMNISTCTCVQRQVYVMATIAICAQVYTVYTVMHQYTQYI